MTKFSQHIFRSTRFIDQLLSLGSFDLPAYATLMEAPIDRFHIGTKIYPLKTVAMALHKPCGRFVQSALRCRPDFDVSLVPRPALLLEYSKSFLQIAPSRQGLAMIRE